MKKMIREILLSSALGFLFSQSVNGDTLVSYDIPPSITGAAAGVTAGTATLGTGVLSASQISLTGAISGTTSASGWRWYDGSSPATDLASALSQNNAFSWQIKWSGYKDLEEWRDVLRLMGKWLNKWLWFQNLSVRK